ncbi:NADPH:quinone reductase [Streptomyces spiroverticillatus]|uniref:NADPH:quinone reductase n=1 Tax=Streptomyces finlayi TaxID=67296 RepID=A0A918X4R6_9ACTN|nr:NADP-dependent oxidoreductase [Streptomyces finlayi]GHA34263.1 NADPH:quinone reductase [Streptomyces spiroverticillatus]GHD11837.1 NADPH:quinone reductase [Streptomyces finlayi]
MEAIVFDRFGGPEALAPRTVADVHAGPGQVRIKVAAAGVNPIDGKIRSGAMQQFIPTQLPAVPGIDVAGVVDEVGEGVADVVVGDEVLGWAESGSYAEYAVASQVVRKPAGLSWEQAAALPVAGETAQRVLDLLGVTAGETLLVNGAAGAVGSLAVQLAAAAGVTVVGTASEANHAYVRELGASAVVTYGEGLAARVREVAPQGVDAVYDTAGHGALPDAIELLGGTTDRVITIADQAAESLGVVFSGGGTVEPRPALAEQARLVAEGRLRVRVAEVLPLGQAQKAHEISDGGHARGKLVLTP